MPDIQASDLEREATCADERAGHRRLRERLADRLLGPRHGAV